MAPCMRVSPFYSLFSFSVSLLHVCMPCQIDKPLRGLSRGGVCMGEHTDFICTSFQYLFCLGMHLVIIDFAFLFQFILLSLECRLQVPFFTLVSMF